MFEANENADVERNNRTTVDSDYDSDNIWKAIYLVVGHALWKATYLIVGHAFFTASKVDCHSSCISHFS